MLNLKKLLISKIKSSYTASICGSKIDKACKVQDNIMTKAQKSKSLFVKALLIAAAIIVPTIFCFWVAISVGPIKVIMIITEPIFWIELALRLTEDNKDPQK